MKKMVRSGTGEAGALETCSIVRENGLSHNRKESGDICRDVIGSNQVVNAVIKLVK